MPRKKTIDNKPWQPDLLSWCHCSECIRRGASLDALSKVQMIEHANMVMVGWYENARLLPR